MRRSVQSPLWKVPVDEEVAEELALHLELRTRQYVEEGLSEEAARGKALERFGDPGRFDALCRQLAQQRDRRSRWRERLDDLMGDARLALRQLGRRPGFTATAVLLLGLGLGAGVASFSLLDRALLQPPPFAHPEGILTVWETQEARARLKNVVGPANFVLWREENESFERLAGFITIRVNLTGDGEPLRAASRVVTEGYFEILGRAPSMGRTFVPEDYLGEGGDVAVLSHRLWLQRFGGDPAVIGKRVEIDGTAHEIVGVMPPGVGLDMGPSVSPYGDEPDLWSPLAVTEAWRAPRGRWLMVLGRLRPGVSPGQAAAEMDALAARGEALFPDFNAGWGAHVVPLAEHLRAHLRLPILALAGAVALMLLIVCVNTVSLLLLRAAGRRGEVALRSALGAGRGRLARQLLTEGAVLALLGGTVGMVIALLLQRLAPSFLPAELLAGLGSGLAPSSLAVAFALVGFATLVFGGLPALFALRSQGTLRSARTTEDRGRHRLRSGLVVAEIALAVVLLVGAGLMLRSMRQLLAVDPGFDQNDLLTLSVSVRRGTEEAATRQFWQRFLERVAALPGVEKAGAVSHIPLASVGAATSYFSTDRPEPAPADQPAAAIRVVRGDYFAAMGTPLLAGRGFDSRDQAGAALGSVVVNQTLAERNWPGQSPLGKQLRVYWGEAGEREVVGVVGDVRFADLETPARDTIYFSHEQEVESGLTLVVRTRLPADQLLPGVRAALAELDPSLPIYNVRSLAGVVAGSVAEKRFLSRAIALFALLALLLAAFGIYSTSAFAVVERTRELGLRLALGSTPGQVAGLVLKQAGRLTAVALAAGLVAALTLGEVARALLFGVQPTDPATLATVVSVLGAAALLAALGPALRAASLEPMRTLKEE
ncbi:MAG TPA: ABC transporter permease [Thermoanaerobaculia bacterium]|nr:ABC transporter permease [Thermoanaerobaculia bacterium]